MKIMNTILGALTVLAVSTALAHPQATDDLTALGVGTVLVTNQAINLPGGKSEINIRQNNGYEYLTTCALSPKAVEKFDREVPANQKLTITEISIHEDGVTPYNRIQYIIKFAENSNFEFVCDKVNEKLKAFYMTVADFENLMGSAVKIKLATPRPF